MSDDNKEKKRPNAKYKLSHEKVQGAEIVYHYNRERRLEKAPQSVRDLYKEHPRRRFGFLHTLIDSKPKAMLFGTIVVICLMMFLLSTFGLIGNSYELDGNTLSIQGKEYDGTVIIEIKKTPKKDKITGRVKAYTGAVDIAVFPAATAAKPDLDQITDIFKHRIFFANEEETEYYRFSVPFEQSELAIILRTEKKALNLTIKPEKNRNEE
jgi:hypothetical protein